MSEYLTQSHINKALDLINAPFSQEKHEREIRAQEAFNQEMDEREELIK